MRKLLSILVATLLSVSSFGMANAQVDSGAHVSDSIGIHVSSAPQAVYPVLQDGTVVKPPNKVQVDVWPAGCKEASCARVYVQHNARVDAGAAAVANAISGTPPAVFTYIAFSADTTAVAKADTTCPSEITTGGLGRAAGTFGGYTAPATLGGTASYTITKSFTVSASYTINKLCLFNAVSGGTMLFESLLGATVTGGSGDTINVTWNVNE